METELWPRFLHECGKRDIPVSIVNGRISDNSFRRYRWMRAFIGRVVNDVNLALMQSEQDAERIRQLGLAADRVVVSGNLKFDLIEDASEQKLTTDFRTRFHFDDRHNLIIAASTHHPEERVILDAYQTLRRLISGQKSVRLLIAPRHPERFSEVAALLSASDVKWARRSAAPADTDGSSDVVLLDAVGELRALYPLASIVFVGGSIAPTGGHNVLEPATTGACIVTGAHTSNFAAVTAALVEKQALIQLPDVSYDEAPSQLARVFEELLSDNVGRRRMGSLAQALCERNRGATERTVALLFPSLAPPGDLPGDCAPVTPAYAQRPAVLSK
jgi:3-deoxy-D-manno-octulosonic-acid transferase